MFEESKATVNGFKLAYKHGPKQGPYKIICLHGWLDNAASFDPLVPLLQDADVYALDLPGHGLSDHLPKCTYYHFIDGVSHIIAFIKTLALSPCILLGHSLGACLASIIAGSIPDKISKLILIDAIGPISGEASKSQATYSRYLSQLNALSKKTKRCYRTMAEAVDARAQKGYLSTELTRMIVNRGVEEKDGGFIWRHDERLLLPSPLRMNEAQVLPFLSAITAPTCLITANNGFDFDQEKVDRRVKAVKNIQHYQMDGGHHIHMEKPNECADIINAFLAE